MTNASLFWGVSVSNTTSRASPDPVPDKIWEEATKHYDQKALAALIFAIANINVWNRLNVAVRQIVGDWKG